MLKRNIYVQWQHWEVARIGLVILLKNSLAMFNLLLQYGVH